MSSASALDWNVVYQVLECSITKWLIPCTSEIEFPHRSKDNSNIAWQKGTKLVELTTFHRFTPATKKTMQRSERSIKQNNATRRRRPQKSTLIFIYLQFMIHLITMNLKPWSLISSLQVEGFIVAWQTVVNLQQLPSPQPTWSRQQKQSTWKSNIVDLESRLRAIPLFINQGLVLATTT